MRKINIAVLASGNGTNLSALIDAVNSNIITNSYISVVISDRKYSYALTRAAKANIPGIYLLKNDFESDYSYDTYLVEMLSAHKVDFILLAGYLRILSKPVIEFFKDRILNIHPSLLPDFGGRGMYGIKVHEQVIKSKLSQSGCSVHIVTEEIDKGTVIAQEKVNIFPDDNPETLAQRVLAIEHKLYPLAVEEYKNDYFKIEI